MEYFQCSDFVILTCTPLLQCGYEVGVLGIQWRVFLGQRFEKFKSECWSHKLFSRCFILTKFASQNLIILLAELRPATFSPEGNGEYFATRNTKFCRGLSQNQETYNFVEALSINKLWTGWPSAHALRCDTVPYEMKVKGPGRSECPKKTDVGMSEKTDECEINYSFKLWLKFKQ